LYQSVTEKFLSTPLPPFKGGRRQKGASPLTLSFLKDIKFFYLLLNQGLLK